VRLRRVTVPLDPHDRIVIRHATDLIHDAALDNHVPFGPMDLQISRRDRRQERTAFIAPDTVHERDAIAGAEMQPRRVIGVHQDGIARRAIQRIDVSIDQSVELLPASRADVETPFRPM
jgi:hypothetical protein